MTRKFYSILLFTAVCASIIACNNGDYQVNPNAGSIINPLNPLTRSQFNWSGTVPLSCTVNGVPFVADSAFTTWTTDTMNGNYITGLKGGTRGVSLYLRNVYDTTVYSMSYGETNMGTWIDSVGGPATGYYFSYLGNSGEVYVVENDSAYLKGYFYFAGVSDSGKLVSIENGYFKIVK